MNAGSGDGDVVVALILVLVIAWIVAGIIGFVVHGLFWLFVIACVLFVATVLGAVYWRGRASVGRTR